MNFFSSHCFRGQTAMLMVWVASSAMTDPLSLALSKDPVSRLV